MEAKKQRWKKFKIVLCILFGVLIVGFPVFAYFDVTAKGRFALREAKNVKLHIQMQDVEMYVTQGSVYDSTKQSGLSDGTYEKLKVFMEKDFDLRITAYNKKLRQVMGFVYTTGNYQVVYTYDTEKGDTWKVNYILNIFDYDGE